MKHIFDRDFRKYLSAFLHPLDEDMIPRDIMKERLALSIRYLSNVNHKLSNEKILFELDHIIKEEKLPDVIDLLREMGFQEGRQEDIERLLRKKILSPQQIAEVLEVDPPWVATIARSLQITSSSEG